MKRKTLLFVCFSLCCLRLTFAQMPEEIASPETLYKEGKEMFKQQNYAASVPLLERFILIAGTDDKLVEVEYMLVCTAYELQYQNRISRMEDYIEKYPDSPYANRIYALMGSAYFFDEQYQEALAYFNSSTLDWLEKNEQDDMIYRRAISYLGIGNTKQAAIWFQTLNESSSKYQKDCMYYLGYIRYTQGRYDEALIYLLPLRTDSKYESLAPFYIADIYVKQKNYNNALQIANNFVKEKPNDPNTGEMYRILGEIYYQQQNYYSAVQQFEKYIAHTIDPQRSANYMLGLSYYQTGVYSKAAEALGEVVTEDDALTQNAYLHLGLSYIQLAEKNKARLAFQQAAASNADMSIKEQAAYNYAMNMHETSFSAFGESVNVFERFLNMFPNSVYADKISEYLIEVYLTTRDYKTALASIERIQKPGRQILEAKQKILFQLGTQSFTNTAFQEAIDYFNRCIAIGQYSRQTVADAYYWRGESYYRTGFNQEASRDFSEYLRLNQQTQTEMYALAHYNLGYTAFNQKNYTVASNWFEKYISIEKSGNKEILSDACNRIGDSYLNVRSFASARTYYSQALAMNTSSGDYSLYQLGLVSGLLKNYEGKIQLLDRLIANFPSSPYLVNALYEKGRAYINMNNNTQAITTFAYLMNNYPDSPMSRKAGAEIGLLYYQANAYDQAIAAYKHVVQTYPGSEEARLSLQDLKSIYIDLNRVNEYAALVASLPGNIQFDVNEQDSLTYVAAERVYARGELEQARQSFQRYLISYPRGAFGLNANYYLALIAKQQKKPNDVLTYTAKLLEYPASPYTEEALVMRGETQFNAKDYQDALLTYKQLKQKASTSNRKQLALTGILRSAYVLQDDTEIINTATEILQQSKVDPELKNEATYYRAKSYIRQRATQAAMEDLRTLAKDTRTLYGAEAKYQIAQLYYNGGEYALAEKELLNFIQESTPHAYWLARGFILLSDVYAAMGKNLDARQYLLSLQQNYTGNDDIQKMIESRLKNIK
ncbi:MAG: tetratricopeptide repeat protein [Bacteroides sp.]|nr:tetratricopeptide repeat protein [Bacteroides sp.]